MTAIDIARICLVGLDGSSKSALCNAIGSKSASSSSAYYSSSHLSSSAHLVCNRRVNIPVQTPFEERSVSRLAIEEQLKSQMMTAARTRQAGSSTPPPASSGMVPVNVEAFTPAAAAGNGDSPAAKRTSSNERSSDDPLAKPSAVAASPGTTVVPNFVSADDDEEHSHEKKRDITLSPPCNARPAPETPPLNPLSGRAADDSMDGSPSFLSEHFSSAAARTSSSHSAFVLADLPGSGILRGAWLPSMCGMSVPERQQLTDNGAEQQMTSRVVPACDGCIFCINAADVLRVSFAWTECVQLMTQFLRNTKGHQRDGGGFPVLVVFVQPSGDDQDADCVNVPSMTAKRFQSHLLPRFASADVLSSGCRFAFVDATVKENVSQVDAWLLHEF